MKTHIIRVNGRRSVVGTAYTPQEASHRALDNAEQTWPHNAHIFDLVRQRVHKLPERSTK